MRTQLQWFALLLAVLQYAAVLAAPTEAQMAELTANGGRFMLRAYNGKYLSIETCSSTPKCKSQKYLVSEYKKPNHNPRWYIDRRSKDQVVLRTEGGFFLRHDIFGPNLAFVADDWEMWTPVKNGDGTWSFTSYGKWLSTHESPDVDVMPENKRCERFTLEPW